MFTLIAEPLFCVLAAIERSYCSVGKKTMESNVDESVSITRPASRSGSVRLRGRRMGTWKPLTQIEVETLLAKEISSLPKSHAQELRKLLVSPYAVPVLDSPGETIYVVAKRGSHVLHCSDVDEGWEWVPLETSGALACRGSNQDGLSHITHQLFGVPNAAGSTNVV